MIYQLITGKNMSTVLEVVAFWFLLSYLNSLLLTICI